MIRLSIILGLFLTASASATISNHIPNYDIIPEYNLSCVFEDMDCELSAEYDFDLVELEEEVIIPFNTKQYLPKGFNPLKGKHDIDWSKIELIELNEDVDILFDTELYLPQNFNPLKGLHDIDWDEVKLVHIEEEVQLDFNTEDYLPKNFCAYQGMA